MYLRDDPEPTLVSEVQHLQESIADSRSETIPKCQGDGACQDTEALGV